MKVWLVELTFHVRPLESYSVSNLVRMTDKDAERLRGTLRSSLGMDPLQPNDLVGFDLEPAEDAALRLDQFLYNIGEEHPRALAKFRKRWAEEE